MESQQKFWTQKLRWAPWLAGILCMCYHSYGQEEVMSFMAPQGEDNQKLHIFPDLVPLCLFLWRVLICIPNFNNMIISLVAFRGTFLMGIHCRGWRHGFNPWVRKIPWKRKWQPSPIFLPGKSHRQRSLVGYSPKGCKEWWKGNRQKGQGSPNGRNSLQVSDIFLSLKWQEETNYRYFFPSLYKFKRRFLLKYCVAIMTPGFTWS